MKFHLGLLPCEAEAIAAVAYQGQRMLPGDPLSPLFRKTNTSPDPVFVSVVRLPLGVQSLDQTDINNLPFYLSTVDAFQTMPICQHQYHFNYNKLQSSIENGEVDVWYWTVPTDEEGFPMVPDHEDYQTALYWYCRMMMIGAGFEDKVFKYGECAQQWERYAGIAINDIRYPSPDEVKRNIIQHVRLIPSLYDWESFGALSPEHPFND
jgi:hypothetical protein